MRDHPFASAGSDLQPTDRILVQQHDDAAVGVGRNAVLARVGIYRAAGIDGATSHSGRRSFITNLAKLGVSARVLMSLAGHQNLSTTQRYIDIKPSMLRAAVELVA